MRMEASDSFASSPWRSVTKSEATTPGPPALVTMASLGPDGRRFESRTLAQLNRSPISSTLTTPTRLKAAS